MSPIRAARPCKIYGCPNLVRGAGSYCEEHKKEYSQPDPRPSSYKRGYNKEWYIIRNNFLKDNPMCSVRGCGNKATDVDHILPLRFGGTHDYANLRALCKSCHSKHTAKYGGGFGNQQG